MPTPREDLVTAINATPPDTARITALVRANPNSATELSADGDTAIHEAMRDGNLAVINAILDANPAALTAKNGRGSSAMASAVYSDNVPVVEALLNRNPAMAQDRDIISSVISNNDRGVVAAFANKDPNFANVANMETAISYGSPQAIAAMLEKNPALATARNADGKSMLELAQEKLNSTPANRLQDRADMQAVVNRLQNGTAIPATITATPPLAANPLRDELGTLINATPPNTARISEIVRTNPNLATEIHPDGDTFIHEAMRDGNLAVINAILDANPAALTARNAQGSMAMASAVYTDNVPVVEALLNRNPAMAQDPEIISSVISNNDRGVVAAFANKNPNFANVANMETAISYGSPESIKVMLEKNPALATARNGAGKSMLELAQEKLNTIPADRVQERADMQAAINAIQNPPAPAVSGPAPTTSGPAASTPAGSAPAGSSPISSTPTATGAGTPGGQQEEGGIMGFMKKNKGLLIGLAIGGIVSALTGGMGGGIMGLLMPLLAAVIGSLAVDGGGGLLGGLFGGGESQQRGGPGGQSPQLAQGATVNINQPQLESTTTAIAQNAETKLMARLEQLPSAVRPTLNDQEKQTLRTALTTSMQEVVRANPALSQNPQALAQAAIDNIQQNRSNNPAYAAANQLIAAKAPMGTQSLVVGYIRDDLAASITENQQGLNSAVVITNPQTVVSGPAPTTSGPAASSPAPTTSGPAASSPAPTTSGPASSSPASSAPSSSAPATTRPQLTAALNTIAQSTEQKLAPIMTQMNVNLTNEQKEGVRTAMLQSAQEVLAREPGLANNPERLSAAVIDNITQQPNNPAYQQVNTLLNDAGVLKPMAINIIKDNLKSAITENQAALTAAMAAPAVTVSSPATSAPAASSPTTSAPATSRPATSAPATSRPATSGPAASNAPRVETAVDANAVNAAQTRFIDALRSGNPQAAGTELATIAQAQQAQVDNERIRDENSRRANGVGTLTGQDSTRLTRMESTARINAKAAADLRDPAKGQTELNAALNSTITLNNGQQMTVRQMLDSPNPQTKEIAISYVCNSCGDRPDLARRDLETLRTRATIEAAGINGVSGVNANFGGGMDVRADGNYQSQGTQPQQRGTAPAPRR